MKKTRSRPETNDKQGAEAMILSNVNKAASLLGKRSVHARKKAWGKREFEKRMREWGKLGGRPKNDDKQEKKQ
jgi:hypothetical protein